MTDLITKKELLELGFIKAEFSLNIFEYPHDIVDLYVVHSHKIVRLEAIETEIWCTATKANVLKFIEIAKLIGELE